MEARRATLLDDARSRVRLEHAALATGGLREQDILELVRGARELRRQFSNHAEALPDVA